jgi:hypothetical protein
VKTRPFKESDWFTPTKPGARDHRRMPGKISGVYAIRDAATKAVLYVGESHTGRLRTTLQRHLEYWIDQRGPREFYERGAVQVAWRASRDPLREEGELIEHYCPRDNTKGFFEHCSGRAATPGVEELQAPDWAESTEPAPWCESCAHDNSVPF